MLQSDQFRHSQEIKSLQSEDGTDLQRKGITMEPADINVTSVLPYHIFSMYSMLLVCPKFIIFWRWEGMKKIATYSKSTIKIL